MGKLGFDGIKMYGVVDGSLLFICPFLLILA
jgi:hypothetical protein